MMPTAQIAQLIDHCGTQASHRDCRPMSFIRTGPLDFKARGEIIVLGLGGAT